MVIIYIPFEELFAPAYQLTYISTDGHIDVARDTAIKDKKSNYENAIVTALQAKET